MRQISKQNVLVVATIVLCFALTLSLSYVFSGEGFLGVFLKSEDESVWAIVSGDYADMTIARQTAELVRARGGAGYVKKDGEKIKIIYAVYKSEEMAKQVLEKLGEKGAYLTQIEIEGSKLSWCDTSKKSVVMDALVYFDLCFDTLFETANALNENNMSQSDANVKIKVLYSQIEEIKSSFYQNIHDYDEPQITEIKLALVTALALVDGVNCQKGVQDAIASMRYQLVQIVLCFQALMTSI